MKNLLAPLLGRFRGLRVRDFRSIPEHGRLRLPLTAFIDVFEGFDGRVYAHLTFGHHSRSIATSITGSGPDSASAVENLLSNALAAGIHARSLPGAESAFRAAYGRNPGE